MQAPIGIMDSGWGGLSVWQSITRALPHESTIYIGDHAFVPYGSRPAAWIRKRTIRLLQFLMDQRVKLVVVACNTATIAGIQQYRQAFPDLPILGVVPVVKTAAATSKTKAFAILSTPRTAHSAYQKELIRRFAGDCTVQVIESAVLVPLIERGIVDTARLRPELTRLFALLPRQTDVIVLGCTHYPFVRNAIRAIVNKDIRLLDSGGAVARHVHRVLMANGQLAKGGKPVHRFFTTGDAKKAQSVGRMLLKQSIEVTHVEL